MLALIVSSYAQNSQNQSEEEIVLLSPFAVEENANIGRYQAVESTSGSRVRMDVMDSTQGISILTNEFMSDVGTGRLSDVVKYVAGVDANNHISTLDTMSVRGFFGQGATIDGFNQLNFINQEPVIFERIEVVKGPNAILAPQGVPGGVINNITKRPLFKNKGYVSYQVGRYDSNRAELDVNYVLRPDKIAFRIVGGITDADDYGKGEFHQNITVMPMFTYRISPTTEFTLQWQAYNGSALTNDGVPVSIYAVGRSNVHPLEGMPRDFQVAGRNITRHQSGQHLRLFLTSQITDKLSMRLAANGTDNYTKANIMLPSLPRKNGAPFEVVKLDPNTGEWSWDGVTRNDNPTYTLGGPSELYFHRVGNLQNDFVYEHAASTWKSKTVAGYTFNYRHNRYDARNFASNPTEYDLRDPSYTPPSYTIGTTSRRGTIWTRSNQVYIYEVLHLFDDRLVVSGSLSQNRYNFARDNKLTSARTSDRGESLLPSGGFVYKFTPGVSVFYGFSKQEILGNTNARLGVPPHTIPTRQHEGGVRVRLFDGKLYASLSYFDILQNNLWVENSQNYIPPQPTTPYPSMRSQRTAKGFEFEFSWAPTKNLSVIGSYTDFKNRDADNMRFSRVAEKMASIWGSYTFDTGPLHGLQVGLGAVYTGETPNTSGFYTTSSTPVRIQPEFWHPSYTMVEASASYRFNKHWHAQLVVKNLFDNDAVYATFYRRMVSVSTPINPKLSIRYEF